MKLAIICHIHARRLKLSTKVYGWLAHSGSDPVLPENTVLFIVKLVLRKLTSTTGFPSSVS